MADAEYYVMDAEFMTDLPALRQCAQCSKPQDGHSRMMRCSRCIFELYCDRECQMAAWHVHKHFCHIHDRAVLHAAVSEDNQAQHLGFRNVHEFKQALRDFVEAHSWAFQAFAKVQFLLRGGPEYMHIPPEIMNVDLQCVSVLGSSSNPAYTFKFLGHRWQTIEECTDAPIGAGKWRRSQALLEATSRERICDPRFIGMLPVMYTVQAPIMQYRYTRFYPQFRPVSSSSSSQDPNEGTLMTDLQVLCVNSINNGLALRCISAPEVPIAALPGRFVRSNKAWTWRPLFTDWDRYLEGPSRIKEVDAMLDEATREDLSAEELMAYIRVM